MAVKASDSLQRTYADPTNPTFVGGSFATAAARRTAGQARYPDTLVYQQDNGSYWALLPLALCFLADNTTPATNRGTWGTLDAHWYRMLTTNDSTPGGGTINLGLHRHFWLSDYNVPDDADLSMEANAQTRVDPITKQTVALQDGTAAIQAVLDFAKIYDHITVHVDTHTLINTDGVSLLVYSNTKLIGETGCGFIQAKGANCFMMRNAHPGGTGTVGGMAVDSNGKLVLADYVDHNIHLENLIFNCNGYLGTQAQQAHDTPLAVGPDGKLVSRGKRDGGWTIGLRFGAVYGLVLNDITVLNQTTFCIYLTNCEFVRSTRLTFRCHKSFPGNSDGLKIHACTDWRFVLIIGRTGDDLVSFVSEDGLFNVDHYTIFQSQFSACDPWAVYGRCTNGRIGEIYSEYSKFVLRTLSANYLIDDIEIGWVHGYSQTHWFIWDNFWDFPADVYTDKTGNNGGNWGRIRILAKDIACDHPEYYQAEMLIRTNSGKAGTVADLRIGVLNSTTNNSPNFPKVRIETMNVGYLSIGGGKHLYNSGAYDNAILEICAGANVKFAEVRDTFKDCTVANAVVSNPIIRVKDAGTNVSILRAVGLTGLSISHLLEDTCGGIKNLITTSTIPDVAGGVWFGASGKSVNVTASTNHSDLPYDYGSAGTLTGKRGDAFPVTATSSGATGAYTPTSSFVSHSNTGFFNYQVASGGNWIVKADSKYINGYGHQLPAGSDGSVQFTLTNATGFGVISPTDLTTKGNVHIYVAIDTPVTNSVELDKNGGTNPATVGYPTQKVKNPNGSDYAWEWFSFDTGDGKPHTIIVTIRQDGTDPNEYTSFEGINQHLLTSSGSGTTTGYVGFTAFGAYEETDARFTFVGYQAGASSAGGNEHSAGACMYAVAGGNAYDTFQCGFDKSFKLGFKSYRGSGLATNIQVFVDGTLFFTFSQQNATAQTADQAGFYAITPPIAAGQHTIKVVADNSATTLRDVTEFIQA